MRSNPPSSSPPPPILSSHPIPDHPRFRNRSLWVLYRRRLRALLLEVQMEHDETGLQASAEGPFLCINNCGFFGSAATMNLCSKCHKDKLLKKEQAQLAASSIDSIVNGKSSASLKSGKDVLVAGQVDVVTSTVEAKIITTQNTTDASTSESQVPEVKGPIRCHMCKKRVGLTGFKCRCGNDFCAMHRYTDKHDCSFDYRTAGRDAIAKANPVVRAEKLDKI